MDYSNWDKNSWGTISDVTWKAEEATLYIYLKQHKPMTTYLYIPEGYRILSGSVPVQMTGQGFAYMYTSENEKELVIKFEYGGEKQWLG